MMNSIHRRDFLAKLAALPALAAVACTTADAVERPPMTVYKTPTCGCCGDWIDHVREAGYEVTVKDIDDLHVIKDELGVPHRLESCHTAVVGPYVVEGHVPADLVDKMLSEKPDARGIAVPGMPVGSPGMVQPGMRGVDYEVLLFQADGRTKVFAKRRGKDG